MKLSELIKKLKYIEEDYGDIETVVQFRDNEGQHKGTDDVYLIIDKKFKRSADAKLETILIL